MSQPQTLPIISEADVARLLSFEDCVKSQHTSFLNMAMGNVISPPFQIMPAETGVTLVKSALVRHTGVGSKFITVYSGDENSRSVNATVLLVDDATGRFRAVIEAALLTAMRTAAASVVATKALARPDAKNMTVFGTGKQCEWHIRLFTRMFPNLQTITIIGRNSVKAAEQCEKLATVTSQESRPIAIKTSCDVEESVKAADIIVTATMSKAPLFAADWVMPGCHINSIGAYLPQMAELPPALFQKAKLVVDSPLCFEDVGHIIAAAKAGYVSVDHTTTLGDVLRRPCERQPEDITVFESVGLAAQDIAAADMVATAAGY